MEGNKLIKDFSLFANDNGVSNSVFTDYRKKFNNTYINPTILEERQMNVTQMDVFSRLFMERILYVGSEINSDVANVLTSQLLFLEMQNNETPITMYINSPGGSVYDGLAIYDTMQYIECPISTICTGMAASMGSILLCAGEKGQRYALPHSRIMLHQPSGNTGYAQASDIEITCNEILKLKQELYEILSKHTGQTVDKITKDADRDHWLTSQEALDYGLIDRVVIRNSK